jgi:CheY-like chemotaxis protein/two-component sensor histidine kinase
LIERQVDHLVRMVDDLMDVSRVMRGRVDLRRECVELAAVVARAVETARPQIDAGRHRLTVDLPPDPVWLDADPVRLAQVFANLLNNAAKYTEPGGAVTLSARRDGADVVVRVADTGVGIPADLLPRVFDLFVQADQSLGRARGGLGIGLTVVKSLVGLHGGTVRASSPGPGRGSVFEVRLPAPADAAGRPPARPPAPSAPPRRVLVVDDNADAADSLAMLLRLGGHDVRVAYDGPAALAAAREFGPQVAFLDIGMPGMDGYEVARRLQAEAAARRPVLVALTGWGQAEDRRRTTEAGFDLHLVKPADLADVNAILAGLGKAA